VGKGRLAVRNLFQAPRLRCTPDVRFVGNDACTKSFLGGIREHFSRNGLHRVRMRVNRPRDGPLRHGATGPTVARPAAASVARQQFRMVCDINKEIPLGYISPESGNWPSSVRDGAKRPPFEEKGGAILFRAPTPQ
jgi:hypothetical protein